MAYRSTEATGRVADVCSRLSASRRLEEFAAVNRVILQSEAWAIHGAWLRERPGDYG
jgi:hypothetical protein